MLVENLKSNNFGHYHLVRFSYQLYGNPSVIYFSFFRKQCRYTDEHMHMIRVSCIYDYLKHQERTQKSKLEINISYEFLLSYDRFPFPNSTHGLVHVSDERFASSGYGSCRCDVTVACLGHWMCPSLLQDLFVLQIENLTFQFPEVWSHFQPCRIGWSKRYTWLSYRPYLLLLPEPLTFNSNWINILLQWYQLRAKNPSLSLHQSQQTKYNESLGSDVVGRRLFERQAGRL